MRIAVFLPNWIGDVVMATPAIRSLRHHFSSASFVGILKPYVGDVLEGAPWFDELIPLEKKGPLSRRWPGVAWKLRRRGIDLAVIFPNSFRSAMVAWAGKCRRRIGYNRYGRRWLLTDRLEPLRDEKGHFKPSPIIDAYNLLVEQVGCPHPGVRMKLYTTPQDEEATTMVWERYDLGKYPEIICLNPGAAYGAAKHWPTEYFATLARKLVEERGSGILVLCGPKERDLARQIANLSRRDGVKTLADVPQSIGLTKGCVRRADMLITTDSGPRHFAAAFDKPVVSLFGPTHIPWTVTYHAKETCLQRDVPCGPCQLRVCPLDHRCMKELTANEVFVEAINLLSRCSPSAEKTPDKKVA
ncbi:MAG: lipopolysaccharide heptosyltransferase II [Gemmataceae bacterium]